MRTSDWSSDVCSSDLSGKLELYGQNLQIVHPDNVLAPDQADELPEREAVYPLSEGLTNKRMAALAVQALERVPTLPEWVEPSVLSRTIGRAHVRTPVTHANLVFRLLPETPKYEPQ